MPLFRAAVDAAEQAVLRMHSHDFGAASAPSIAGASPYMADLTRHIALCRSASQLVEDTFSSHLVLFRCLVVRVRTQRHIKYSHRNSGDTHKESFCQKQAGDAPPVTPISFLQRGMCPAAMYVPQTIIIG